MKSCFYVSKTVPVYTMYAEKAAPRPSSYVPKGPKPVFVRGTDVRNIDNKALYGEELYLSVASAVQRDNIILIQQIRNLWRIYLSIATTTVFV